MMTKKELFDHADELKRKINELCNNTTEITKEIDKRIKIEMFCNLAEMKEYKLNRAAIREYLKKEVELTQDKELSRMERDAEKSTETDLAYLKDNSKEREQAWLVGINRAFDYSMKQVRSEHFQMSVETIQQLHSLIYLNIAEDAGLYRRSPSHIFATEYLGAAPEDLERLTEHFINQLNSSKRLLHPIEYAAICHKRIIDISPYAEGNEEVALLLMNMILVNEGYGATVIPASRYSEYIGALTTAQRDMLPDFDVFIKFIAECIIDTEKSHLALSEATEG